MIGGVRIVGDPNLVETVENWTEVRSRARAARRLRRGYRQRIRYVLQPQKGGYLIGDALVVHPAMIEEFRKVAAA